MNHDNKEKESSGKFFNILKVNYMPWPHGSSISSDSDPEYPPDPPERPGMLFHEKTRIFDRIWVRRRCYHPDISVCVASEFDPLRDKKEIYCLENEDSKQKKYNPKCLYVIFSSDPTKEIEVEKAYLNQKNKNNELILPSKNEKDEYLLLYRAFKEYFEEESIEIPVPIIHLITIYGVGVCMDCCACNDIGPDTMIHKFNYQCGRDIYGAKSVCFGCNMPLLFCLNCANMETNDRELKFRCLLCENGYCRLCKKYYLEKCHNCSRVICNDYFLNCDDSQSCMKCNQLYCSQCFALNNCNKCRCRLCINCEKCYFNCDLCKSNQYCKECYIKVGKDGKVTHCQQCRKLLCEICVSHAADECLRCLKLFCEECFDPLDNFCSKCK